MRILVAHNAYLYRGGEDTVVEAEISLLRRYGHDVMLYRRDNAELDALPRWKAAADSVWSKRTIDEVGRLLSGFRPHLMHVHNTFPLISPSLFGVADRWGVPVVKTLHNFRLLCPQAMLMRNGRSATTALVAGLGVRCYIDATAARWHRLRSVRVCYQRIAHSAHGDRVCIVSSY